MAPGEDEASVVERNVALVRRGIEELYNGRRLEIAPELYHEDARYHIGSDPPLEGREAWKEFLRTTPFAGFPDTKIVIEDIFGAGDKVTVRWSVSGTNTGELLGMPPTGKSFEVKELTMWRLVDGKVAEAWFALDRMTQMQQLGVIPDGPPPKLLLFLMKLRGRKSRA